MLEISINTLKGFLSALHIAPSPTEAFYALSIAPLTFDHLLLLIGCIDKGTDVLALDIDNILKTKDDKSFIKAKFCYFATSTSQIWGHINGNYFFLSPESSFFLMYASPNCAVPFVWLNYDAQDEERIQLVRHNLPANVRECYRLQVTFVSQDDGILCERHVEIALLSRIRLTTSIVNPVATIAASANNQAVAVTETFTFKIPHAIVLSVSQKKQMAYSGVYLHSGNRVQNGNVTKLTIGYHQGK